LNGRPIVILLAAAIAASAGCSSSHAPGVGTAPRSFMLRVRWAHAEQLIRRCKVRAIEQTHSRAVTLTLRDGRKVFTHEPHIDDVFDDLNRVTARCRPSTVATE
jgi:hypothetical protein